jgi:RNA-binding protein 39
MVQPTMSEKNRLAAAAESLKKAEGPKKLYVGSLHHNINEDMLHGIFSPFGNVERVSIMRDSITNISRGYAFVEFRESDSAEKAMSTLNNFELAGQQIKVNYGTVDTSIINIDSLDGEDMDVGVGMTPQSRVALMHKLAEGHNANILPPGYSSTSIPISSCCLVIGNMFDPAKETGTDWDREIHDDVLEECMKIGTILHVHVDKFSQGNVYVKCQNNLTASQVIVSFAGRQYAGNYITAELMSESTYHLKFPGAIAAIVPLRL